MLYIVSNENKDVIRNGLILLEDKTFPLSSVSSIQMEKSHYGRRVAGLIIFIISVIILLFAIEDHAHTERLPWVRYFFSIILITSSIALMLGKVMYFLKLKMSGTYEDLTFTGEHKYLLEIKKKVEEGLSFVNNNKSVPSSLG